jgi:cobalamin biosynthesis protein CobT
MTDLEKELTKASGFKPPKGGYDDRQDHLAALARLSNKMTDEQFDDLSDDAANWVSAAIKALNAKTEIEDFEDADQDTGEEPDEAGGDEADTNGDSEAADTDDGDGSEDDPGTDEAAEAEAEAEEAAQAKKARSNKPAKGKGHGAAGKKQQAATPDAGKAETPRPKKVPGIRAPNRININTKLPTPRDYSDLTGEKDRYGLFIGTKTHDAVMMYEKGCTTHELREKLDGRFYNVLKKLENAGHYVERFQGGIFKVTHKDDIKTKGKK